jgi:Flp pilus assembly pilin Flp
MEMNSAMLNKLIVRAKNILWRLRQNKSGQTIVEYSLLLLLVVSGAILILHSLGSRVEQVFSAITSKLDNGNTNSY